MINNLKFMHLNHTELRHDLRIQLQEFIFVNKR